MSIEIFLAPSRHLYGTFSDLFLGNGSNLAVFLLLIGIIARRDKKISFYLTSHFVKVL